MNGKVESFKANLSSTPVAKDKDNTHFCAPRVKSPLLDRILKLGNAEMPKSDKEFWAVAPKVNTFILSLIEEKVGELEAEMQAEAAAKEKAAELIKANDPNPIKDTGKGAHS